MKVSFFVISLLHVLSFIMNFTNTVRLSFVIGFSLIKLNKEYNKLGISSELIIYPKMRHEILNEEENQKVYLDILNFLNK